MIFKLVWSKNWKIGTIYKIVIKSNCAVYRKIVKCKLNEGNISLCENGPKDLTVHNINKSVRYSFSFYSFVNKYTITILREKNFSKIFLKNDSSTSEFVYQNWAPLLKVWHSFIIGLAGKFCRIFDSDEDILLHAGKSVISFYTNTFKRFWWKTYKIHAVGFSSMH